MAATVSPAVGTTSDTSGTTSEWTGGTTFDRTGGTTFDRTGGTTFDRTGGTTSGGTGGTTDISGTTIATTTSIDVGCTGDNSLKAPQLYSSLADISLSALAYATDVPRFARTLRTRLRLTHRDRGLRERPSIELLPLSVHRPTASASASASASAESRRAHAPPRARGWREKGWPAPPPVGPLCLPTPVPTTPTHLQCAVPACSSARAPFSQQ